jgi:hypothetical protein
VDTKQHVTETLNPFYQWKNNNTQIAIQHDSIQECGKDSEILIGALDVNYSVAVQLNVTTRLKISFTCYMSNEIMSGDSYGIYKALYNPTEQIVDQLMQEVTALRDEVAMLRAQVNDFYYTSQEYRKNTFYRKGVIVWITPGTIYQTTLDYTTTAEESVTVEEALAADVIDGKLVPLVVSD